MNSKALNIKDFEMKNSSSPNRFQALQDFSTLTYTQTLDTPYLQTQRYSGIQTQKLQTP